jgi:hypothetical protein
MSLKYNFHFLDDKRKQDKFKKAHWIGKKSERYKML